MRKNRLARHPAGAARVAAVTLLWNLLLVVLKLSAGLLGHSGAMVSDAIHSASDVCSTLIVMVGVRMAGKASDDGHPYGHERMECAAAVILAALLFATGLGIGVAGLRTVFAGNHGGLTPPGWFPLAAAVISIGAKEGMYWYARSAAKRLGSEALMADAWHHRSDALSSVGSLIGIAGARLGFPVLDPIASIGICLLILKVAVDIFRDAMGKMTDHACDGATLAALRELILSQPGVLGLDDLKTRRFGEKLYVDVEISADASATFPEAHAIAESTHTAIEQAFPNVKHCMVHINPLQQP